MKHDQHYRNIEGIGIEPVETMETRVLTGIPKELHQTVLRNFRLAQAINYQTRCGEKGDPITEIEKAENWLHRAKTGTWKPEQRTPEQELQHCKDVEQMFGGERFFAEMTFYESVGNLRFAKKKTLEGFRYKGGFFFEDTTLT